MPTPIFSLRVPMQTQLALRELAKVYGAPNPRAFAREILEVITSTDMERIKSFNQRLITRMGEQLVLKLNAVVDTGGKGEARKPRKKRRPRDRTT